MKKKAYRDTWGRGLDSYLHWFYETIVLLRDLLSDDGSIYVHLDWHVFHYAKPVLDEVFGAENFLNEIVWRRKQAAAWLSKQFGITNDSFLLYVKGPEYVFNPIYSRDDENTQKYLRERFIFDDGDGRKYMKSPLVNPLPRPNLRYPFRGVQPPKNGWLYSKERMEEMFRRNELVMPKDKEGRIYRKIYEDSYPGQVIQNIWTDIPIVNPMALERLDYPTQKPEGLLDRIIRTSSNEGQIVLDCFVGSGTTAAVGEKLKRRWIACDLGRFAIHTTRKRLLGIANVRPFVVQNLGKYERQVWQAAEFPANGTDRLEEQRQRDAAYRQFILELYHATALTGHAWLHGAKGGRMVHVGAVDAPVTLADVKAIAAEAWKAGGGKERQAAGGGEKSQEQAAGGGEKSQRQPSEGGEKSQRQPPEIPRFARNDSVVPRFARNDSDATHGGRKAAVDILGWDFAFEVNELAKTAAAESRVEVAFKKIPREVLEKKAVDQGDIHFFELGALDVEVKKGAGLKAGATSAATGAAKGREVTLKLKDFVIPMEDIPEEARRAIKHWSQLIDYWAVDWDYREDTFHNQWQTYRTRKNPKIELETSYKYAEPGKYLVVVKVIDILGNDTTKTVEVKVSG